MIGPDIAIVNVPESSAEHRVREFASPSEKIPVERWVAVKSDVLNTYVLIGRL